MTLSFRTIGFPEHLLRVESGSFNLENFQSSSDSVLSRMVGVAGMIEQRWACNLTMATMNLETANELASFRARLSGQAVLFTLYAPGRDLPLGAGAGFAADNDPITITGTTITGTSILEGATTCLVRQATRRYAQRIWLKGLQPSSVVLKHGDLFGIGGNLYMAVANVTSDANGEASVPFRWKLWKGAKAGDIVTLRRPTCRVQLKTANEAMIELSTAMHGKAAFSAIEVPYV